MSANEPQEVLSNADVDVDMDVTSSTMILGAQNSVDEGTAEDASMLVDATTPVELRQTNVTTVPKGHFHFGGKSPSKIT